MAVYVDTCIILDTLIKCEWTEWAEEILDQTAQCQILAVSPSVFSELSVDFDTPSQVVSLITDLHIALNYPNEEALFLAAKKHLSYRKRGGTKTGTLSDFFIGAQAVVEKASLITRDSRRFKAYFPTLNLITPESA